MRKFLKQFLVLALCLCMALGGTVSAFAAGDDTAPNTSKYASDWEYKVDETTGVGYWMLDEVYCENPVLASAQHLVIYAPAAYMTRNADGTVTVNPNGTVISSTGVIYTAETAPMLFHNTSGGYTSSKIQDVDITYLQEGYVHVSIQTRGKEITDDAGKFIGQFPAIMVDLKAGIRFLKANDAVLPGNSERIVSRGFSSGGAVSAMLGASGNSPLFESYLNEIGAADAGDDIFIALASAPITNLSSADASYEWYQHANEEYFLFNAMAFDREGNDISDILPVGMQNFHKLGDNVLGGAHEDELSDLLYDWYVDYVQDLGFDLGDDGRSGSFYDGFAQIYSDALAEFIARYDELKGPLSTPRAPLPDTVEEYLASLEKNGDWFDYNPATGKVTIHSLDDMVYYYLNRGKMCPSLDSYNYKSNENDAFKDADGNTVHFSGTVRDALKELIDNKDAYGWTDDELAYIQVLYEDYNAGISDESSEMLEIMSPINYVVGKEGYDADIAPYWRLRVGSSDGDHGAPAAWLIAQGLEKYQPDVDVSVGIAWAMGHSLSELTEQDMYNYIADIMVKEDGLRTVTIPFQDISTSDWFWNDAIYAAEAGLLKGTDAAGTMFDPAVSVNRAMVVTVLYRLDGEREANTTVPFTDVSADAYYAQAVAWAANNGITQGRPDGTFAPEEAVSRQDLAVFLYNYARYKGLDVSSAASLSGFSDAGSVSGYATSALAWANAAGLVNGTSATTLSPLATAQRSQLAAILHRFANLTNMSATGDLMFGAGSSKITFDPAMFPMEGFDGSIHDDPYLRVFLFENGSKVCFISAELVTVGDATLDAIRELVMEKIDIPSENIWIASTHAITTPHEPSEDAAKEMMISSVTEAAAAALDQAIDSFQPAVMGVGTCELDINVNRNIIVPDDVEGGPYYGLGSTEYSNKVMTMVRFDSLDGDPIGFYLSYGIKPTAIDNSEMEAGTRTISADIPGVACAMVEEELGAPCMFNMPAAGDQYPKEMALYYGYLEDGTWGQIDLGVKAGVDIVERLGEEMGETAVTLAQSIQCTDGDAAVRTAEAMLTDTGVDDIPVSFIAVGDLAFVGEKPEIDAVTEQEIWADSPFGTTILVASLSSQPGPGKYMPHAAAYDFNNGKGTFEAQSARVKSGTAEKYVDTVLTVLKDLKAGSSTVVSKPDSSTDQESTAPEKELVKTDLGLTEEELETSKAVEYLTTARCRYDESANAFILQFSLETYVNHLSAHPVLPVMVDIQITNNSGTTVYESTTKVLAADYNGTVASVTIPVSAITAGNTADGTIHYTVYNDGFSLSKDDSVSNLPTL